MNPDSRVYRPLVETWRSNTRLEPPLTGDELQRLFATHGIYVTQDVAEFYSLVGGMENGCPDDHMLELWCPNRIDEMNSRFKWDFLWFGDWLMSSHLYALSPIDERHSAIYIDHKCDRKTPPEFLTGSLYEFAERLVCDPASLGVVL